MVQNVMVPAGHAYQLYKTVFQAGNDRSYQELMPKSKPKETKPKRPTKSKGKGDKAEEKDVITY